MPVWVQALAATESPGLAEFHPEAVVAQLDTLVVEAVVVRGGLAESASPDRDDLAGQILEDDFPDAHLLGDHILDLLEVDYQTLDQWGDVRHLADRDLGRQEEKANRDLDQCREGPVRKCRQRPSSILE